MAEPTQADVKKLSFERAIEELESIVKRLEDGKVPLEELVAIYERGEALKRRCEELLRQAEARVDKITHRRQRPGHRNRAARRQLGRFRAPEPRKAPHIPGWLAGARVPCPSRRALSDHSRYVESHGYHCLFAGRRVVGFGGLLCVKVCACASLERRMLGQVLSLQAD